MENHERPWSFIITMAGVGSRFRKAGYDCPKYMIETCGKTLFEWSLRGLLDMMRAGDRFVFVARKEDDAGDFIRRQCAGMGVRDVRVIELDATTDGQATTAKIALDAVPPEDPIAIYNIDTGLVPGFLKREQALGDGWIPCFRAPGVGWSFCRTDDAGRVVEVREKVRISDFATIGLYWFGSARLYFDTYRRYYGVAGREEKGERYVAPMYNQLIGDDGKVSISEIPLSSVIPLGTPEEVARFEEQQKHLTS